MALVEVDHEEERGAVQRPLYKVLEAEVGQADLKYVSWYEKLYIHYIDTLKFNIVTFQHWKKNRM